MTIAVLAASGRSGRAFIQAALAAGHSVRAGARNTSSLPGHPNLTAVRCDAGNQQDIEALLRGSDAVVSLIGHVRKSPKDLQTKATGYVMNAMHELGIKRLVSLTGTGVRMPGDHITLMDRLLNFSIMTIDPARIRDGIEHVRLLKQSDLSYTVIRVLKLQNTPAQPFNLHLNGPTKVITSRHEVAQAILEVLENDSFVRQAPIIAHI